MTKPTRLAVAAALACGAACTAEEPPRGPGTEHHVGAPAGPAAEVRTGTIVTAVGPAEIEYELIDGKAILEGDILVPWSDFLDPDAAYAATVTRDRTWPNGVVPFVVDGGLPAPQRVTDAIQHWHGRTGIRLVPRTTEPDFVRFVDGGGCSSWIGRIGGPQDVTLNAACSTGNAIHEIGHAIGLWHEQSRADRDDHVIIHWNDIQPAMEHNFNRYPSGMDLGPYDFDSVMHYGSFAFSVNGRATITRRDGTLIAGQRDGLSAGDVTGVQILYGFFPPTQHDWRWCHKCQGLFFSGNSNSVCPAGGAHENVGSGNYHLAHDLAPTAGWQSDWRWCHKCQGLFFAGHASSACPAGGAHENVGSGNYSLLQETGAAPDLQPNWRWCHKCQGLFFGGHASSACPAGGAHENAGSGNYSLIHR